MGWSDYGFPDPTMMPCYLPAMAFYRACAERWNVTGAGPLPQQEPFKPDLFNTAVGSIFSYGYYPGMDALRPWRVPVRYINHLIDFENEPVLPIDIRFRESDYSANMNSIIEERDTSGLGYLNPSLPYLSNMRMLPEWSRVWLCQRYLALNLLKIHCVSLLITYRNGESDMQRSPQEAFDRAVELSYFSTYNSNPVIFYIGDGTSVIRRENAYAPGIDGYFCKIGRIEKIEVDYSTCPNLIGLPAFLYMSHRITDWNDRFFGYIFDKHGFPVREGEGLVAKIALPWESTEVTLPDHGLIAGATYGFASDIFTGGIDVSSKFEFYDNVDRG